MTRRLFIPRLLYIRLLARAKREGTTVQELLDAVIRSAIAEVRE